MKKENILDNLAFIVGVLTVVLAMIFKDKIIIVGLIGGCGATLYGLFKALNKNTYGYIFLSIGLGLVCSLSLYTFKVLDRPDSLTFMICSSTFLLMFITLIFDYFNNKEILRIYSMKVEGEVVDLIKNPNTNKEYYQIQYAYQMDDKWYTVERPGFINKFLPKIGDKLMLNIDPSDYSNVYFFKSTREKVMDIGLALFLMGASLIIIITLFI